MQSRPVLGRIRQVAGSRLKRLTRHRLMLPMIVIGLSVVARLHRHPIWWVQLGRARELRGEWEEAAQAYGRAARLDTAGSGGKRGRFVYAAARRVQAMVRLKDWAGAIEAGELAVAPSAPLALHRALTTAYQQVGDWPAAVDALRRVMGRRPDSKAANQLAECLQMWSQVPFSINAAGAVRTTSEQDRIAALDEAIRWRAWIVDDAPGRPKPLHDLGMAYERAGRWPEAARAYEQALALLPTVDASWCLRAAHEWAYRLGYVAPDRLTDPNLASRLGRAATPAGPVGGDTPAGFFDVLLTCRGLALSGFLVPGHTDDVEIALDGQVLKAVSVDTTVHRPAFRFELTNGPLQELPDRAMLTVRSAGRPLVNTGGTETIELRVPNASGAIVRKLVAGAVLTKKGTWARTDENLAHWQSRALAVYDRARESLAAQGRDLFLWAGTLLGCHRDKAFIRGDDDFDAGYLSRAPDPKAYRQECFAVALAMLRDGFDITFSIAGRAFKVGLDGVRVDITPIWFYRGRAWGFTAHSFGVHNVLPVAAEQFLGRAVAVPRDPEVVLADTYGPTWRTPQPGFTYYTPPEDARILRQMLATPSEVREFARRVAEERTAHPGAGRFLGTPSPGYPGISWLTSPEHTAEAYR
ncbi:MAG TPA: tetratricopeptide repeat protein [Micromonosporaceae bacterium]